MQNEVTCLSCGTIGKSGQRFCQTCGTPSLLTPPARPHQGPIDPDPACAAAQIGKRCPACLRGYPPELKFCKSDGTPLVEFTDNDVSPVSLAKPAPEPTLPPGGSVEPSLVEAVDFAEPAIDEPSAEPVVPSEPTDAAGEDTRAQISCRTCGTAFPADMNFCELDGTPLGEGPEAEPYSSVEAAAEDDLVPPDQSGKRWALPVFGAVALLAAGGAAYFGSRGEPASTAAAGTANATHAKPGLLGVYRGHIADQDIILRFGGTAALPLSAAGGTIEYLNRVTSKSCAAAVTPALAQPVADVGTAQVKFEQSSIKGKTACARSIPITATIDEIPPRGMEVLPSVRLQWTDPESGRQLMAGKLERDPNG